MVKTAEVVAANSRFASEHHEGRVCVFAGATSGIGLGTLRRLATMLYSSKFYILGRSESKFRSELERLKKSAPTSKFVVIEAQVSLIRSIDAASERIISMDKKIDLLCISPGGMPFQGEILTEEGLELYYALSYWSRARLVSNLLPLLRQSREARVLSILNGTLEKKINEDDIGLKNWGIVPVVNHTTMCTSLAFDCLAAGSSNKRIAFIHVTPGFVNTGTPRTTFPSKRDGYLWWAFVSFMQIVSGWIIIHFGKSLQESGERHAFYLTSDEYKPGLRLANRSNDAQPPNTALKYYQERGWQSKIWDLTV
ncbi:hypothetical protein MGN70_003215 [Eutypa lata]|nr:hypothetical protein MGN70_003215 [Eutypa lata]